MSSRKGWVSILLFFCVLFGIISYVFFYLERVETQKIESYAPIECKVIFATHDYHNTSYVSYIKDNKLYENTVTSVESLREGETVTLYIDEEGKLHSNDSIAFYHMFLVIFLSIVIFLFVLMILCIIRINIFKLLFLLPILYILKLFYRNKKSD